MVITYATRTHVKSIKATCRRGDRSTKLSYAPRRTEHDMRLKWPHAQTEAPAPRIPALDELDQAFKQSSLGKAADEARLHAQWRELSNRFINDHDLVEARANAGRAKTDLEKRHRLRAYYTMFYDRM